MTAICGNGHDLEPGQSRCLACGARMKMQWMKEGAVGPVKPQPESSRTSANQNIDAVRFGASSSEATITPSQMESMAGAAHLRGRADAGDTAAMRELAELLIGVAAQATREGKVETAAECAAASHVWLVQAADLGDPIAMTTVGVVLLGNGNRESGIDWLTKATRLGESTALQRLVQTLGMEGMLNWLEQELPRRNPEARKLMDQIRGE